jgi:hypothetical protein
MNRQTKARPHLRQVPVASVFPPRPGDCLITMSVGQWDALLAQTYKQGWTLLELDDDEQLVAAYQRPDVERN